MTHFYQVFGLSVASALRLPAVALAEGDLPSAPDVTIEFGDTPMALSHPQASGVRYQAAPGEFLLRVDRVARFYVRNGDRITVSPEPDAREEDILPFLMGSVSGALLQQREMLVLHASAIEVNGESVLFCGPSGVGKSTLAAGFRRRGHPFLADDLCAIVTLQGRPALVPGFPRLKLWADALERLDTPAEALERVRWGTNLQKYFLPAENQRERPVPVRAVFILAAKNSLEAPALRRLDGSGKIDPLLHNSYRMRFLEGLGGRKAHFKQCAAIAGAAEVFEVFRPRKGYFLEELMDLLAERLA